jgi:hypothetical protein
MIDVHDESVVNGERLPTDIWSSYMAEATTGAPVLDFSRPNRRQFVPRYRGYAASPAPGLGVARTRIVPPPRGRLAGPG